MTRLPGDSWTPPSVSPAAAPAVDPWGRPPLDADPAADRRALALASAQLNTGLAVLMAALGVGAVASALALFLGGRAGLNLLQTQVTGLNVPAYTLPLLALAALLVLAWAGLYLGVVFWARELLTRLASWALNLQGDAQAAPAPDAVRAEQLRRTLSGWLTFGQWGTVAGVVLSVATVPVMLTLAQQVAGQLGARSGEGFEGFGPGFAAIQTASSLVSSLPGAVVVWLILGAIRRFMNLAVARARGVATGPVLLAAKVVGNWFLLCLVLIGLVVLNLLVVGLLSATLLPLVQQELPPEFSTGAFTLVGGLLRGTVGVLIFSALLYALYFALLVFSRTYALALGRLLDQGGETRTGKLAAAWPASVAGETPNTYRGQF